MFGVKIFDDKEQQLTYDIIQLAQEEQLSIEVALYNNNEQEFISWVTNNTTLLLYPHKSIHLNYRHYLVSNINEKQNYPLRNN